MGALTEWKGFAKLLQSFAGQRVGREVLRWAPDEYRDSSDNPEFLQLGAVAATMVCRQGSPGGSETPDYRIWFNKRVKKGEQETTKTPLLIPMSWDVVPEKPGHWSVSELGNDWLLSKELAEKTKDKLIWCHNELSRALEDLKARL